YNDPTPPSRQTRKQLARIDEQAQVRQAALAARLRQDLARVSGEVRVAKERAQELLDGGFDLAGQTVRRATILNYQVTICSQNNPGLELNLRDVESTTVTGAKMAIIDYLSGR